MAETNRKPEGSRVATPAGNLSSAGRTRTVHSKRSVLKERSPFLMREAYKALRTNVAFSLPGSDAKVIAVTSANRSEGKSLNSVNIAISFAQIGKRVILFDCDLRLPTVATKLGVRAKPGLSDYLVGQASFDEIVHRDVEGVDIVPAGSIPPDPTGLFESEQIERVFLKMREYYDYIFIDLPPVNTVTDAAILSRCIDGFLLVVRHNSTENKHVAEMVRQLRFVGAKILGFVYNDVPVEGKRYYSRYYYAKSKK